MPEQQQKRQRRNYVKLNVNEDFDPDLFKGLYDAVISDFNGKFVAAENGKSIGVKMCSWPRHWTYSLVLIWQLQSGYNCMEMSSDKIELIETLKNGGRSFGLSATIFHDILIVRPMILTYHLACDFSHIIF